MAVSKGSIRSVCGAEAAPWEGLAEITVWFGGGRAPQASDLHPERTPVPQKPRVSEWPWSDHGWHGDCQAGALGLVCLNHSREGKEWESLLLCSLRKTCIFLYGPNMEWRDRNNDTFPASLAS